MSIRSTFQSDFSASENFDQMHLDDLYGIQKNSTIFFYRFSDK